MQPSKFLIIFLLLAVLLSLVSIFVDGLPLGFFLVLMLLMLLLILKKPLWGIFLIIPTLFFEGTEYSIYLFDMRFRLYHFLIIILLARLLLAVSMGKERWKKTPLDIPLLVYLGVNIAAFVNTPSVQKSLEITFLIASLIALYYVLTQGIKTKVDLKITTIVFLVCGFLQGLLGLLQMASLYLGFRSLSDLEPFHQLDVFPYGRPVGTFVETDWFGVFLMAFFVILFIISISGVFKNKKLLTFGGVVLGLICVVLSGVRGAWLGGVAGMGLFLLMLLIKKYNMNKIFQFGTFVWLTGIILTIFSCALVFNIDIIDIFGGRISSIANTNQWQQEPRTMIASDAWNLFIQKPILGNGPGSYSLLGIVPYQDNTDQRAFLTNLILTVLNDTGSVGLIVFIWILWSIGAQVVKTLQLKGVDPELKTILVAFVASTFCLFVAYQITTGFWLGMTWFFMAMTVSAGLIINNGLPRSADLSAG